jgi:glutaredoxin
MRANTLAIQFAALALCASFSSLAVTVVTCKDKEGNEFFSDHCPAGTLKLEEKQLRGGSRRTGAEQLAEVAKKSPVVLFTVPDCDACDLVRSQLKKRRIPYTEKDVGESLENQTALREITGSTTVPAVAIGSHSLTSYSRAALDLGLNQAGYPVQVETVDGAAVTD